MKTLIIWAPIALKGLTLLFWSTTGGTGLLAIFLLKTFNCAEPSLPPDTLTFTL